MPLWNGMIVSLSPMRKKYFEGELTDGHQCVRIVGFDKNQQQKLDSLSKEKLAVQFTNCETKQTDQLDKVEILVKSYTGVALSPSKFDIKDLANIGSKSVSLSDVSKLNRYDRVTVRIQVVKINDPDVVGNGKRKQDVTIADSSSSIILTLWEDDIGSLEIGNSYELSKVLVQQFKGHHYLSYPSNGGNITPIDDVDEDPPTENSDYTVLESVEVVSVSNFSKQYLCLFCKAHVNSNDDTGIGKCCKCASIQKLSRCKQQLTCKLGHFDDSDNFITLHAYENILQAIVTEDVAITESNLLQAKPFSITYNQYCVITSVSRA